jgi:hypothetical protein
MSDEPSANAASNLMVAILERMNSFEEWPETPTRVAAEFVLDDRRRGGFGLGRVDRDVAMAYSRTAWEVGRGPPIQRVRRLFATLGDRLVAALVESDNGEWESESIMVWQIDRQLKNLQIAVMFDADDVDAAVAELDRMQVEMEAEPETPSSSRSSAARRRLGGPT